MRSSAFGPRLKWWRTHRDQSQLARRLAAYPDAATLARKVPAEPHGPVLTIHFRKDDTSLKLFTTIATLGTAHDVTLQEIRIESFFPADAVTARMFRAWAVRPS